MRLGELNTLVTVERKDDDLGLGLKLPYKPCGIQLWVAVDPDDVPALGTVVTATLTYVPRTGQTVGAVRAGTGFLTKRKVTAIENDSRILLNWSFQFNGKTDPTYTAGS